MALFLSCMKKKIIRIFCILLAGFPAVAFVSISQNMNMLYLLLTLLACALALLITQLFLKYEETEVKTTGSFVFFLYFFVLLHNIFAAGLLIHEHSMCLWIFLFSAIYYLFMTVILFKSWF